MTARAALVTGASSGLGAAIARELAAEGYIVGLVARRRERLEALARELPGAHVLAGDLRDAGFAERVVDTFVARTERLDLVVNNAGAPRPGSEPIATDAQLTAAFALNVFAAYQLGLRALPHLERTRGSVVNIGSAGVARTIALDLVYLASKGALEVMSRGMAKLWAPRGVRVNTVSPGLMPTEIFEAIGLSPDDAAAHLAEAITRFQPLERAGDPRDVARAVVYLASERAPFITGATLAVDGGMSLGG